MEENCVIFFLNTLCSELGDVTHFIVFLEKVVYDVFSNINKKNTVAKCLL